jgi:hypothetical protein
MKDPRLAKMMDPKAMPLGAAIGSVAHLGYHLGAIRQLVPSAAGPRATD